MASSRRGPKKDSKRYRCRNEACERFGRIQYIQPWGKVRCKFCGSENIEQVESRASTKPAPLPGPAEVGPSAPLVPGTTEEPYLAPEEEPPPTAEPAPEEATAPEPPAEPPAEDKIVEPPAPGVDAAPEPVPAAPVIKPKTGDLVACKTCGWAVYWDEQHHRKAACYAAGCGSTDIEIRMPVEGK